MSNIMKWMIAILWLGLLVVPCWIMSIQALKKVASDHSVKTQNRCLIYMFCALCSTCALIVGVLVL